MLDLHGQMPLVLCVQYSATGTLTIFCSFKSRPVPYTCLTGKLKL